MNKYYEMYNRIMKLYSGRRYKEFIRSADKFLKLDLKNGNYIHNIKFLKSKALRYLGYFDEAILELRELRNMENDDSCSTLELYYIYYFLNRYEEALELLPRLYLEEKKPIHNHTLLITELVMKKHLGLPIRLKNGTRSDYIKDQILNYSYDRALEHIECHKYMDETNSDHSCFYENVDVGYLMECVKANIKHHEKVNQIDALEIHCFSVFGIGYDQNNMCNYLKVVVCPNTTNIITMYPFAHVEGENFLPLECDMDKLFKKDLKEKTISRIDRFNKRVNLK